MTIESLLIQLVRREHFCASHRLYNPAFDKEWNERIYGKCSRDNGHGHKCFFMTARTYSCQFFSLNHATYQLHPANHKAHEKD